MVASEKLDENSSDFLIDIFGALYLAVDVLCDSTYSNSIVASN